MAAAAEVVLTDSLPGAVEPVVGLDTLEVVDGLPSGLTIILGESSSPSAARFVMAWIDPSTGVAEVHGVAPDLGVGGHLPQLGGHLTVLDHPDGLGDHGGNGGH